MNISAFKQSKYMTKANCERPILCTVESVTLENVAPDGQAPENKAVIHWEEDVKGLVQGSQGLALIAKALGSEDTDDWVSKRLTVFVDPAIAYGGKLVGGIRCRAPKSAKPVVNQDAEDDE